MKVGIVVYSQTGHTLEVANSLYKRLKEEKVDVNLEEIKAERDMKRDSRNFTITFSPKVSKYDVIIFASYIEAFSLCPVMKKYLDLLGDLNDKRIISFVTQHFSHPILGGNRGLKNISKIVKTKNGVVDKKYVINWSNKKREEKINDLINDVCLYLKN